MKKKQSCPAWFTKLASELARRNTGAIDVSVAQCSEILGHLADYIAEKGLDSEADGTDVGAYSIMYDFRQVGFQRMRKRLAAAKRKK